MTSFGRLAEAVGAIISVKTDEAIYTGTVHTVNKVLQRLTLTRVKSFDEEHAEIRLPGIICFHKDEILDFEFISFPKPKPVPPKRDVPVKNSPVVSQPPRQSPAPLKNVVEKSQQPEKPTEVKATATQNGCTGSENLKPNAEQVVSEATSIKVNSFSDPEHGPEASLPNSMSKGMPNGIPAQGDSSASAFFECNYFTDAKSSKNVPDEWVPDKYVVIEHIDDSFYEMLDRIYCRSVIGCGFDGVNLGRQGKLCYLQIGMKDLVVIFDLLSMNCEKAFEDGLRGIFTSQDITKVIHDCRQASDLLFHQFGIQLANVFDTQIADVMATRNRLHGRLPKYVRNLSTCLKYYLGMSMEQVAFYDVRKVSIEKDNRLWSHRPMTNCLMESMGLNVRYLRELRMALMEEMLVDFTSGVDIYLHLVRDQKDEDAIRHIDGEFLPPHFHDLSYASIIESDPNKMAARGNSPQLASSVNGPYKDSVAGNHRNRDGHPVAFTDPDDRCKYDDMPSLTNIEDIDTIEKIVDTHEHGETLEMPDLEDLDLCDSLHDDNHVEPARDTNIVNSHCGNRNEPARDTGFDNSRRSSRNKLVQSSKIKHNKPFESSDEENSSFDLRYEQFSNKMSKNFHQKTPNYRKAEEATYEPEFEEYPRLNLANLSSLSNRTQSGTSVCSSQSYGKPSKARVFADEPVKGMFTVQPNVRVENLPNWQEIGKPTTTHLNILPAGMKPVSNKRQ